MSAENKGIFSHLFALLPDDWDLVPLADAVDYQEGPGILAVDFHDTGVPLLRLSSIANAKTTFDGCDYLDPQKVEKKWSHFRLKEGDILLSTSGSLGRVSEVSKEQEGSICYTGIIRFRPKLKSLKYSYIKYFLQSRLFEEQALASAAGSVLKHFGPSHLKQMSFPVPPDEHQVFIEKLIAPIDAKLQINNKINQTLEQMAQAIFKSWFVNFDPVRAKKEGRQPEGIDADTAALFPNQFEDSSLGPIPKGWQIKPLDSIANFLNGLALQKFPVTDETKSLPVIKIAQLKKGDTNGADRASSELKAEYIVHDGDVLFSWSGSLEVDIWCGGDGALNQHLFKVTSDAFPKWFYLFWTKYHLTSFQETASGKAVTMGHIQRKHLTEALCIVPDADFLEKIDRHISNLISQQINLRLETRNLAAIRDALLPKLLSGELQADLMVAK